jgi:uncharacterized protein (DUF2062 family)
MRRLNTLHSSNKAGTLLLPTTSLNTQGVPVASGTLVCAVSYANIRTFSFYHVE